MLEGKNVRLRVMEGDDLKIAAEWNNDPDFFGKYNPLEQASQTEFEKRFENFTADKGAFMIEKKDGTKIGFAGYYTTSEKLFEIGFALVPNERDKGHCTEAAEIIVDYLFLSKDIIRVQATQRRGMQLLREFWRRQVSRRRGQFASPISSEENGETLFSTSYLERSGVDRKY